jgi:hypothetical protein
MSINELIFKDIKWGGLGTILCTVSSMISMERPVVWELNNSKDNDISLGNLITESFDISPTKFRFNHQTDTTEHIEHDITDVNKFFSPYIPATYINHNKSRFEIRSEFNIKKPCVGVSLYCRHTTPGDFTYTPFNEKRNLYNKWPEMKMWPLDVNLRILKLLVNAGYDIITFDSPFIKLHDKIYMLNNYCDFVIGYEGAIHHLAHSLNIPSIVLPWRQNNKHFYNQTLHLDKKTWIFEDIRKILNFSHDDIIRLRDQLANNNGNNIFLNSDVGFSTDYKLIEINGKKTQWQYFNEHSIEFMSHIPNKKIGGIKDFYYF